MSKRARSNLRNLLDPPSSSDSDVNRASASAPEKKIRIKLTKEPSCGFRKLHEIIEEVQAAPIRDGADVWARSLRAAGLPVQLRPLELGSEFSGMVCEEEVCQVTRHPSST